MKYTYIENDLFSFLKLPIFALRIIMLLRSCLLFLLVLLFLMCTTVDYLVLKHYCNQHGGHLVHVTNAMENGFIKERLRHYARTIRVIIHLKTHWVCNL